MNSVKAHASAQQRSLTVIHVHLGRDSDRHPIIDNYRRSSTSTACELIGSHTGASRISRLVGTALRVVTRRLAEIRSPQVTIWHAHDPLSAVLLSALRVPRLLFDVHEDYGSFGGRPILRAIFFYLQQIAMASAGWMFFPSTWRRAAAGALESSNVSVIENLFLPSARADSGVQAGQSLWTASAGRPLVLLYAGTIREGRGLESLLSAVARFEATQVRLLIAGGADERWKRRIEGCPNAEYVGLLSLSAARELSQNVDLAVATYVPNSCNNWLAAPTKLFELAYLGVPCLVNALPYVEELRSREFSHLVLAEDLSTEGLGNAIGRVLAGDVSLHRPSEEARRRADWRSQDSAIRAAYAELAGR